MLTLRAWPLFAVWGAVTSGFVALGQAADAPADIIRDAAERSAWAAIAARFDGPTTVTKGKDTVTLRVDGLKGQPKGGGMASVTVNAQGRVINVTSNAAAFTNEEFRLFAAFGELTALTLWHNGKIDPQAKTSPWDGTGLNHLMGLANLRRVTLAGGALSDAGMAVAARLPALTELHIWHASFTDQGVACFRKHPRLEVIKIGPMWKPDLTDKSLEALSECPKLRHIQAAEMYLTWEGGLKHLLKLPSLERVDLKNCLIVPADVARLRQALPRVKVDWEGLAGAGATLAESTYSRRKAESWMPKDLIAQALAEAKK